jgi:hypothetical protein
VLDRLTVGKRVVYKAIADPSQGTDRFKAVEAWHLSDIEAEKAMQGTVRSIAESVRAANVAELDAQNMLPKLQSARMAAAPPGHPQLTMP